MSNKLKIEWNEQHYNTVTMEFKHKADKILFEQILGEKPEDGVEIIKTAIANNQIVENNYNIEITDIDLINFEDVE